MEHVRIIDIFRHGKKDIDKLFLKLIRESILVVSWPTEG